MSPETLAKVDMAARVFWLVVHLIGFVFIFRCWRAERRRFYAWFAVSWFLMSLQPLIRFAQAENDLLHVFGSLVVSPLSALCGLVAFHFLARHLNSKIATIFRDEVGNYHVRRFTAEEDARETLRPPPAE